MRIAVVNVDKDFAGMMAEKIQSFVKFGDAVEIDIFTEQEAFLTCEDPRYDVYFLDICLPWMDGIRMAEMIHNWDPKALVILVTEFPDFVYEGYRVSAYDYVLKKDFVQKWNSLMERLAETVSERRHGDYYLIHKNGMERVEIRKILYIASFSSKACLFVNFS